MRVVWLIMMVSLVIAGCSRSDPPPAPSVAPSDPEPSPPAVGDPSPPSPPSPPSIDRPAPSEAPGMSFGPLDASSMQELERRPGATPPLVQGELPGHLGPSPTAGPDDALVRLVLFSDFQCPVCRRVAEPIKHLVYEFPGEVQIIWKHNALTSHARAEPAAIAAIAAARQGRFWDFHDRVFQDIRALSDADLERHAQTLGLDLERFAADRADPAAAAQVAFERALAESLDARGTPSFFVNGQRSVGWGSYAGIRAQVARAIDEARVAVDAGVPRAEVAIQQTVASGELGARLAARVFGAR